MKRIVTLFLSLILLLSCLCAPASAMFDPSLFYEVQARSAYIVNTDTNIIVYDKDSSRSYLGITQVSLSRIRAKFR